MKCKVLSSIWTWVADCISYNLYGKHTSSLNLFLKNHLQNLLLAFLTLSLFELVDVAIILAFSSFLVLHNFLLVSYSTASPYIIIKGIAIWGVRRPAIRGDVIIENSLIALCGMTQSPVVKCKVFQQPSS